MEALIKTDTQEAREAAVIAINQAVIRQGLDIETVYNTGFVAEGTHWTFSTAGLTKEEHEVRFQEIREQFDD